MGLVANGIRLRRRAGRLTKLGDHASPGQSERHSERHSERLARLARTAGAAAEGTSAWKVVNAIGVTVTPDIVDAAIAHAETNGLDVVDLVPADLPVDRALETLRMVDPGTYRSNRLAPGRGAFQATVVRAEVLGRAQISDDELTDLDPVQYLQMITTLKRFAPTSCDVVVAPALRASDDRLEQRRAFLRAVYGGAAPASLVVQAVEVAGLSAGLGANPPWGVAAVAAYSLQPQMVFGGTTGGLTPRDLTAKTVTRVWHDARNWWATASSSWRSPAEVDTYAARRPAYDELLAAGTERFFEARRTTCPWCDSTALTERIRVPDRLQHKPGEFVLDECGECGHIFQNPRLSIEGLDFYYNDFYDGIGGEQLEFIFGASSRPYTGRAETVKAHATPKRWLDVGAGHGHFCLVAKEHWPDTVFDGLDMSESIEEAARRGWIDHSYRGMFPELAKELVGEYDVVSMHHYLEHTREPFDELDAAATTLCTGGHLLIELPDPESRWGRLLGGYWLPWFQPQHQHLMPIGNLKKALEARGFTIVTEDRGEAEQPVDLLAAVWFVLDGSAPVSKLPWRPEGGTGASMKRGAAFVVGIPFLIGAVIADNLLDLFMRNTGGGNTYRVLARKD